MKRLLFIFTAALLAFAINMSAKADPTSLVIYNGNVVPPGYEPNSVPLAGYYCSEDSTVSFYFDYPNVGGMLLVSSLSSDAIQIIEFGANQDEVEVPLSDFSGLITLDIFLNSGEHYYTMLNK